MNTENNNTSSSHVLITTDIRLWELLFPELCDLELFLLRKKQTRKLTKAEAFCYLIHRWISARKNCNDSTIPDISILTLSEVIGWGRNSTKKFLVELEKIGVIKLVTTDNQTFIHLNFFLSSQSVNKNS